jgi:flagellar basal body P-ring formation protein FlgA
MTRYLALALLLGFGIAAADAEDAPRPVLKSHATITGDVVKVGDLIENAGIIAKVPIFRAPDLGSTGTVPAEAIVQAVSQHALIGLDTAGLAEVTVTRPARTIPAKEIEEAVAQALADQYQLGPAKDVSVAFDGVLSAIYVEPSALGDPRVSRVVYDARSARFDATLDLPTGTSTRGALRLTGRARATAAVVTVAHAMERGSVLKSADVVIERRPRAEVGRDALTDIDRAIGLAARSSMQAGQIVRATDLAKPDVVQRNDLVTLTYVMPGIRLTIRGKALDAGAEGDTISVVNEQSKRTLQAVVTGPGRALISNDTPRLAANLTQGR